jgi:hypothetical protein
LLQKAVSSAPHLKVVKTQMICCQGSLMELVRLILHDIMSCLSLQLRTMMPRMVQWCAHRTEGWTHICSSTLGMMILLSHMISIQIWIPFWLMPPGCRPPASHVNAGTRFPSMAIPSGDKSPMRITQSFLKDSPMILSQV